VNPARAAKTTAKTSTTGFKTSPAFAPTPVPGPADLAANIPPLGGSQSPYWGGFSHSWMPKSTNTRGWEAFGHVDLVRRKKKGPELIRALGKCFAVSG
jgi:hypothetical protein